MADALESRTITVRIARPQHEVYDLGSARENVRASPQSASPGPGERAGISTAGTGAAAAA